MNVFVISDTHFSHRALVEGREGADGRRDMFDGGRQTDFRTVEEMDETIITLWNASVGPNDKVYHLGDVAIKKNALKLVERLNGRKTLIMGNHDIFNTREYMRYFENCRAVRVFDKLVLTHIPLHPNQFGTRFIANVHGHSHRNNVETVPRLYWNVCVEQTSYAPVSLEELRDRINKTRMGWDE